MFWAILLRPWLESSETKLITHLESNTDEKNVQGTVTRKGHKH